MKETNGRAGGIYFYNSWCFHVKEWGSPWKLHKVIPWEQLKKINTSSSARKVIPNPIWLVELAVCESEGCSGNVRGNMFSAEHNFLWLILAAKFSDSRKVMAKLAWLPPLSGQAGTHWHTVFFSSEAHSISVLLKKKKNRGLPFCLTHVQFYNCCKVWVLQLGVNCHMTSQLPLSSAIKPPLLIIIIYCSLNSASKSGSYSNSGNAKRNRCTPVLSCLVTQIILCKRKTQNKWRMESVYFPFVPFLMPPTLSSWIQWRKTYLKFISPFLNNGLKNRRFRYFNSSYEKVF